MQLKVSMDGGTLEEIKDITRFKLGRLLVRRSIETDCSLLLEKIKTRISCWVAKLLSNVGGLVIFSIQNFWCRHFILPKSVIKKINQLCIRFFWKGNDIAAACARSEGGLGMKERECWNRACILKLIRCILAREEPI
ncbi:Geminivirus AR1/BR1 coat protein [Gossypium australe]|uniref:Geminivirus AR1/BR1 coat protein n=1 Tax=Gossypium australe TaxID=47621 RepID=A0A5B6VP82_9ROSI|nr:Geminivirus AR1/BR1 coat protein [Gossypium australe]